MGLSTFFSSELAQRGTGPLRKGVEVAIYVDTHGPFTLLKEKSSASILSSAPKNADMTFHIPHNALKQLLDSQCTDLGKLGVEIIKFMAHSNPDLRIKTEVHIGLIGLLRNGYLGVLPLGGMEIMKFLASKGFTSIGKVKDAIMKLRD